VLLLVLDGLSTTGGSIAIGQVKVAVTAAATAQTITVATRNVAAEADLKDSGSLEILDALEESRSARVVVVGLEDGHAWWESRLLLLSSGAARLGRPEAIAFTATRQAKKNQFVGWAHPNDIRRRILDENPDYAAAFDRATALAAVAWLDYGTGQTSSAVQAKQFIVHTESSGGLMNPFLEEQFLADALSEAERAPKEITAGRLTDLLDPVLHTESVDRTDGHAEWFRKALRSDEQFIAVTDTGEYVTLMARTEVVAEVLLALTEK